MPHIILKQRFQESLKTDVLSLIGDIHESAAHFASVNEKMKGIPRPASTPVGQFERTGKDEWSWTAPSRNLAERVLIIILNELEEFGWNLLTQYVTDTSTVTYLLHKSGGSSPAAATSSSSASVQTSSSAEAAAPSASESDSKDKKKKDKKEKSKH